ncbi:MAG: hypothetical protein WCJ61_05270, partial [Paludibacter sp.]
SLKQISPSLNVAHLLENYNYIDLSSHSITHPIVRTEKPLLLDFNSNNPEYINQQLSQLSPISTQFSIFEIISACTYFPLYFMEQPATLEVSHIGKILLWEGVDLSNKKITERTRVR